MVKHERGGDEIAAWAQTALKKPEGAVEVGGSWIGGLKPKKASGGTFLFSAVTLGPHETTKQVEIEVDMVFEHTGATIRARPASIRARFA